MPSTDSPAAPDLSTFSKRLRWAMERANKTNQSALAREIGVKPQNIQYLIDPKNNAAGSAHVASLALALKVNPVWLTTGTGTPDEETGMRVPTAIDLTDNPDYPAICYVSFKLSAGASGFGLDYKDERKRPLVFGREWYVDNGYQPAKLFAIRVANGSMEPGLHHGDTVVVNTGDTNLKDGEVFAMNFEGELVVKRMVRDGGQWWLTSDNPDQRRYPRKICDEHVFCVGRVVHKQSERI